MCLSSEFPMDIERQRDLFNLALEQLADRSGLINQALEVFEAADRSVTVSVYEIPVD